MIFNFGNQEKETEYRESCQRKLMNSFKIFEQILALKLLNNQ